VKRERDIWALLKDDADGLWKRIENRLATGWPDTVYLLEDGRCGWIELKYLGEYWEKDFGLRADQKLWLWRWSNSGGKAFVLARYGGWWYLVPGTRMLELKTKEDWLDAAVWCGVELLVPEFYEVL